MHPLRWLIVLGAVFPLLTLSAGCGNTQVAMPGEKDLADLTAGRRSLVLLRGVAETPKEKLRTAFGPGAWRGSRDLCVARLDGEKQLRAVGRLRSPTKAALRDGWVYLLLKPGTYYLSADWSPHRPAPAVAVAPGPRPGDAESFGWLLDVPGNAPVVYAGTLSFVDRVVSDSGDEWHPGEGRRARIRDESSRASAFASDHFPSLAKSEASVVHAYLGPVDPTVAAGLETLDVRVGGAHQVAGFDVHGAVVQDAAGPGIETLAIMGRPGNDAGMAGLLIITAGAAWAGVGTVAGSVGGGAAAREYQPCVNEAVECARQFKMAERIQASLASRLGVAGVRAGLAPGGGGGGAGAARGGVKAERAPRPALHVDVEAVRLRPCDKAHLACVEVRCRAKLFDPASGRHVMDRVVLYSNESVRDRHSPFGKPLDPFVWTIDAAPTTNFRALAKQPPQERRRHVNAELERAAGVIAQRIADDLRPIARPATPPNAAKEKLMNARASTRTSSVEGRAVPR